MRYFRQALSILPLLLITAVLWGQEADQKRMKRDIEVAEKILSELLQESIPTGFRGYDCEGAYIDGFGVLFSVSNPLGAIRGFVAPKIIFDDDGQMLRGSVRSNRNNSKATTIYGVTTDSVQQMNMDVFREVTENFLADYAYLLTKVPSGEKICIKYAHGQQGRFGWSDLGLINANGETESPGFTALVRQQTVQDYRMEKIDRKALTGKIEYREVAASNAEQNRDLVLLHSIFKRLYQQDLTEHGLILTPIAQMEEIAGLGAVFSYRFTTPSAGGRFPVAIASDLLQRGQWSNGIALAPTEVEEEQPEETELDLEAFLEDFLANVVEYGSTVRSLKPDEVLNFQLQMPSCNCDSPEDWPKIIKIVAKQDLLERYRKGDIDLDGAVEELQVTKM